MSVIILARLTAAPGKLETVLEHVRTLTAHAVNDEPGTLLYIPTQDPKDPSQITIWEEYASEEAFKAHVAEPPFVAFQAVAGDILAGELKVERLNKLQ